MTISHWMRKDLYHYQELSTDILIVGAGYAGLSAAYWISELRPDLKITLVDRTLSGAGASGRNAGFLTKGSAAFFRSLETKWGAEKSKAIYHFANDSLDLLQKHVLKASPEVTFEKTSSLTLIQNEQDLTSWSSFGQIESHYNFIFKAKDELPSSLHKNFLGGYESEGEFKVNPIQLLSALRKILESRNVEFQENSSVFELTPEGILTENSSIKAKKIILAINGYFPEFSGSFAGIISPKRAQMLAVEIPEELPCPHLYYDPAEKVYWRKAGEKMIVIGGKRLLDEAGENGDFEKISAVIQDGLESYLTVKLELKYKVLKRWSGIMGFTENELPLIQKISSPVETYMIGGFSGHGMGFGFKSGLEVAEMVTGSKEKSFFDQFGEVEIKL